MAMRFVAGAFALAALGAAVTAAAVPKWYEVTTMGATLEIGLFRRCAASSCSDIDFDDVSNSVCTRSGTDANRRWIALKVCAIIGMAMSFVAAATMFSTAKRFAVMRIVALLLASLTTGFTGGFAIFVLQYWYFCDTTPCKLQAATTGVTDCTDGVGYAIYLQLGAVAANFIGLIFAAIALLMLPASKSGAAGDSEPLADAGAGGAGGAGAPPTAGGSDGSRALPAADGAEDAGGASPYGDEPVKYVDDTTSGAGAGEEAAADGAELPELPEGDWAFDPDSGMYWSEENQLFLHRESGYFYDPSSGMWFDGENWIAPEE